MSAGERANQPIWSKLGAIGLTPVTGTRPRDGLNAHTPQKLAGLISEP
nr:hypothetical protein [Actinomadura madurae]